MTIQVGKPMQTDLMDSNQLFDCIETSQIGHQVLDHRIG